MIDVEAASRKEIDVKWTKQFAFGRFVAYLIDESNKKVAEVTDFCGHGGSEDMWFIGRLTGHRPYQHLGEYRTAEAACQACEAAIALAQSPYIPKSI